MSCLTTVIIAIVIIAVASIDIGIINLLLLSNSGIIVAITCIITVSADHEENSDVINTIITIVTTDRITCFFDFINNLFSELTISLDRNGSNITDTTIDLIGNDARISALISNDSTLSRYTCYLKNNTSVLYFADTYICPKTEGNHKIILMIIIIMFLLQCSI